MAKLEAERFSRRVFLKLAAEAGLSAVAVAAAAKATKGYHEYGNYEFIPQDIEAMERALEKVDTSADPKFWLTMMERLKNNHEDYFLILLEGQSRSYRYFPDGKSNPARLNYTEAKFSAPNPNGGIRIVETSELLIQTCSEGTLSKPVEEEIALDAKEIETYVERNLIVPPFFNDKDWNETPNSASKHATTALQDLLIGGDLNGTLISRSVTYTNMDALSMPGVAQSLG